MRFKFKTAEFPLWLVQIGSLVLMWWPNEPLHRRLEILWRPATAEPEPDTRYRVERDAARARTAELGPTEDIDMF